ncbi:MAG: glycosyltransferase [Waddliaceae bacterium]
MITTSFPRFLGDYSGVFVFRLCRALVSLNVKINVVAPSDRNAKSNEIMDGCVIHRFSYFLPKSFEKLAYGPGGIPKNLKRAPFLITLLPFFVLMFFIKTLKVSNKVDLFHAHWLYSGIIASLVKILKGTPFIVTLRGSDVFRAKKGRLSYLLSHWVMQHADFITTVNKDLRNWVIQEGVAPNAVFVIRNGVELNKREKREKLTSLCRFLFVGHLVPAKGLDILIESIAIVYRVEKTIHLTIVGDGQDINRLKSDVQQNGLHDHVNFLGTQPSDQIPLLMHQADCLVLPSLREGTPNVILEAMACGLPVVATDLPGIREVVKDGITGHLVKPKDVNTLTEKLLEMIRNPKSRQQMGEKGFQSISEMKLGWDYSAKQYLEIYKKTCAVSRASSI